MVEIRRILGKIGKEIHEMDFDSAIKSMEVLREELKNEAGNRNNT